MSRQRKTILVFAAFGLAMSVASYAYAASVHYTDPMSRLDTILTILSVVFCPAQLVFAFCIDCEATGYDGVIMYSIVAVLNVLLYALVGFIVATLRKAVPDNSPR